jgi:hypothetical protein
VTAVARAVVALALVAAPLAAQAPGLPVHGGGFRQGLEAVATIGWTSASSFTGDATTYGFGLSYGSSRVGISGSLGLLDHSIQGSSAALGVLGSFLLLGNGVDTPFEVSLFGGYGWFDRKNDVVADGATALKSDPLVGSPGNWRVFLGGSLAAAITTPYASIRPWLAPRAELFQLTVGDATSDKTRLAGSAGIDVRFPGGPGIRLMWDQVDGYDSTLGVGLSYRF